MILYHGSCMEVPKPDLIHSRLNVDFGRGFYTTPILEQAEAWCSKFKKRRMDGILSTYTFDEEACKRAKVLEFDSYSETWLDFIISCRNGRDRTDYDIVIGGVANDKVFNTIELYFDQLIDKKETIKRLCYEKPNLQICFRNQQIMDRYLHYERSCCI